MAKTPEEHRAANIAYQKAYRQRPEVKERQREYCHRPEVKERRREYMRQYNARKKAEREAAKADTDPTV